MYGESETDLSRRHLQMIFEDVEKWCLLGGWAGNGKIKVAIYLDGLSKSIHEILNNRKKINIFEQSLNHKTFQ